jgi:hypothetical protein
VTLPCPFVAYVVPASVRGSAALTTCARAWVSWSTTLRTASAMSPTDLMPVIVPLPSDSRTSR